MQKIAGQTLRNSNPAADPLAPRNVSRCLSDVFFLTTLRYHWINRVGVRTVRWSTRYTGVRSTSRLFRSFYAFTTGTGLEPTSPSSFRFDPTRVKTIRCSLVSLSLFPIFPSSSSSGTRRTLSDAGPRQNILAVFLLENDFFTIFEF